MRGVKAKRLRREALARSAGVMPLRSQFYLDSNQAAPLAKNGKRQVWVITDMKGWKNEGTVRGIYRMLKGGPL